MSGDIFDHQEYDPILHAAPVINGDIQRPREEPYQEQVEQTRHALGLPEQSPLLVTGNQKQQRHEALTQYLEEQEKKLLNIPGFIDTNKEHIRNNQFVLNVSDKLRKSVLQFQLRDVQSLPETLSVLEKKLTSPGYDELSRPEARSGLRRLADNLTPQQVTIALERIQQLGFSAISPQCFQTESFVTGIVRVGQLEEEQFTKIAAELNPYFFLQRMEIIDRRPLHKPSSKPDPRSVTLTKDFARMMEIVATEGLTTDQRDALDVAKRCRLLFGEVPFLHGHNADVESASEPTLHQVLDGRLTGFVLQQSIGLAQDALYRETIGNGKTNRRMSWRGFFRDLQGLSQSGDLPFVTALVEQGVDCTWLYDRMKGTLHVETEYVGAQIRSLAEALANEEKRSWLALFHELTGSEAFDFYSWKEFSDLYQNRLTFRDASAICGMLEPVKQEGSFDPRRLISISRGIGSVSIDANYLHRTIESAVEKQSTHPGLYEQGADRYAVHLESFDRLFLRKGVMNNMEVDPEDLPIMRFIADHHETCDTYISPPDRVTAALVEKALSGEIPISKKRIGYWMERIHDFENINPTLLVTHIDILRPYRFLTALDQFFEQALDSVPAKYQPVARLLQSLDDTIRYCAGKWNGDMADLAKGTSPSMELLHLIATDGQGKALRDLLTEARLSSDDYSSQEKQLLRLLKTISPTSGGDRFLFSLKDAVSDYITTEGKPTAKFFDSAASDGIETVHAVEGLLSDEIIDSLPREQQIFWRTYRQTTPGLREFFVSHRFAIDEVIRKTRDKPEKFQECLQLMQRVDESPSREIQRMKSEILGQLMIADAPLQTYSQVERVFLRNNLPTVGKVLKVFELLYPATTIQGELQKKSLSPILTKADPHDYLPIIQRDLVRVYLESGSSTLRAYLQSIDEGMPVMEAAIAGEQLSDQQQKILDTVFPKIRTLSDLVASHHRQRLASDENTVINAVQTFAKEIGTSDQQSFREAVSRQVLQPVGIETIPSALSTMEWVKIEADERNRRHVEDATSVEGKPMLALDAGDCIKGVNNIKYLGILLNNGLAAKEFLGADANSDSTPFGTDVGVVTAEDAAQGFTDAYRLSPATDFGDLAVVIKDRGQFQKTRLEEEIQPTDRKGYELYPTGVLGARHYDIRTGIASSEIDFMIAKNNLVRDEQKLSMVYFTIAQGSVYIPVVDTTGTVIFSPEDFAKYRLDKDMTRSVLGDAGSAPHHVIDHLKQNPYLKRLYESDAGVNEGWTIEQHTGMVMDRYEKQKKHGQIQQQVLDEKSFRLLFANHDIGKPVAIEMTGSKENQHEYTKYIVEPLCASLGYPGKEADIVSATASQDFIGEYLQSDITQSAKKIANEIRFTATSVGIDPREYFALLKDYYLCDTGAYTHYASFTDASGNQVNGKKSLEYLFDYDVANETLSFSKEITNKLQSLEALL